MRICHGSVPLIVLVLILSVSPFVAAQSSHAVLKAIVGPSVEVVAEDSPTAFTLRICKDCMFRVRAYFTTSDPNLDGKPLVPVPVVSDPKVISVDTSLQPTAVWNGAPAEWKVTPLKAGGSTLRARDPSTGTISDVGNVIVMELRRIVGKYELTDPKDQGISDTSDTDVRSFWVVRGGKYVNEVKLKASFIHPGELGGRPSCFFWTVTPSGATVERPKAANTKLIIKKPGTYKVRAYCVKDYKEITVYAIQVQTVFWKRHKNPLTPNPGTGLSGDLAVGQRIFPGKRTYRAKANAARKVKVVARINPPIAGIDLYFRGWDVDDPSWNSGVVDGDTKGDDNRGTPKKGSPSTAVKTTNAAGEATLTIRLPRQPGDNLVYSVATTSESDKGIAFDDSIYVKDGKPKRIKDDHPTKVAGVTPLLTIWRKLHYEMDHMSNVSHNYKRRRITAITAVTATRTRVRLNRSVADPRGSANRFENGRMQETGPGGRSYPIVSNRATTVLVTHPAGNANRPRKGRWVDLFDDDIQKAGVSSPDPDWLTKLLRHCYIVPRGDQGGGTAPFALNYDAPTDAAGEITPYYKFDTKARNDDAFWVVYLLGAYQYDYDEDEDPNAESATFGIVDDLRGLGASVFTEAIYDKAARAGARNSRIKYTTAHETMHLFDARHGDGKFMGGYSHHAENLSAASIKRIRSTVKP